MHAMMPLKEFCEADKLTIDVNQYNLWQTREIYKYYKFLSINTPRDIARSFSQNYKERDYILRLYNFCSQTKSSISNS